ncbi:MAG TPA: hypothetical protein EYH21_00020 [Methanothermococcus okinawensis]|uniref:Uncharacterized protein n=1 Tax=Methanothermococcus okinawensis TaxID=155863 RepID=A0A832ZIB3_9EURY|nr:hypothetical protein [Methanothermococcus okinawensis]
MNTIFLESEVECLSDPRPGCITYLDRTLSERINIVCNYYLLIKKPLNTTIFQEVILKFPLKKRIIGI